jgi:glycogen phosphorylase
MTASMNGSINFSTYDGWIPEYSKHGVNSFHRSTCGSVTPLCTSRIRLDLENLLNILEDEIIPAYYDKPA